MPIASITSNSYINSSPPTGNVSSATGKSVANSTPSTIVTLSARAQQLGKIQASDSTSSQSATPVDAVAKQSLQSVPKESNEASGIQLMQGSARAGRISTYA